VEKTSIDVVGKPGSSMTRRAKPTGLGVLMESWQRTLQLQVQARHQAYLHIGTVNEFGKYLARIQYKSEGFLVLQSIE
jgi:hypothetical protein